MGGLSHATKREELREYFRRFGAIETVSIILDKKSSKSRGFGFVVMKEVRAVRTLLQTPHVLHGRRIECKPAYPIAKLAESTLNRKVFIGGLPPELTQREFDQYFRRYGALEDSVVMKEKATGKPRGFGFVTFATEAAANKVIEEYATHQLKNKWVECKLATPKEQMCLMSSVTTSDSASNIEEVCMSVVNGVLDEADEN